MTISRVHTTDPADPAVLPAQVVGPLALISAIIRLDPDGIYVHTNSTHRSCGVDRIEVVPNGRIKVTHPRAGVCTHISVMGDESVSATRGIIVGASGGGASTELELYDTRLGRNLDLTSDSDYARVASAWSNIWFAVWQVVEDTPTS